MNVWLSEIWRTWRASLRKPGFLLLAASVLALGVGASTTTFTMLEQMVMRPLPLPQASRLVVLGRLQRGIYTSTTAHAYARLQGLEGVTSMGLMSLYDPTVNVVSRGVPFRTSAIYVDRSLLPTLGLSPLLGRNFTISEDSPHGLPVVMLSHDFWKRHYGSTPDVIGQVMKVKGKPHVIVGVLPHQFSEAATGNGIVLPAALGADNRDDVERYVVVARLARSVSPQAVGAEVNTRLQAMYADMGRKGLHHVRFGARNFHDDKLVVQRFLALGLQPCGVLVLLIALVNLTCLMLLRVLSRHHDMAVRESMGASRFRLILPAMAEGLLVGALGAALGVVLAVCGVSVARHIMPTWINNGHVYMDGTTVVLAVVLALVCACLAMALGLWRVHRMAPGDALREGGRHGAGRHQGYFTRVLVIAQVALGVILLGISGIFLHGAYNAARIHLGFSPRHVLTAATAPTRSDYPDARSVATQAQRLREHLRAIPGVVDATVSTNLPVDDHFGQFFVQAHAPGSKPSGMHFRGVGDSYFRLFDIKLIRGRYFTHGDWRGSSAVAIVSQSLADRLYGGHALGQRIRMDHAADGGSPWQALIVGVVADTYTLDHVSVRNLDVYVPLAQVPDSVLNHFRDTRSMRLALRVRGDPAQYRKALRDAVATVVPEQPLARIEDMRTVVSAVMGQKLGIASVTGAFALLAMLLAGVGMYAVMSVAVATREHELGVRKALGASAMRLALHIWRGGLIQVLAGLVIGMVLMTLFLAVAQSLMPGWIVHVQFDPWVTSGVCVFLLLFGLLACMVPAWRAAHVMPMRALQGD